MQFWCGIRVFIFLTISFLISATGFCKANQNTGIPGKDLDEDELSTFNRLEPEGPISLPNTDSGTFSQQMSCLAGLFAIDHFNDKDGTKINQYMTDKSIYVPTFNNFILSGKDPKTKDPGVYIFTTQGARFITFRDARLSNCIQDPGLQSSNSNLSMGGQLPSKMIVQIDENKYLGISENKDQEINIGADVQYSIKGFAVGEPACLQKLAICRKNAVFAGLPISHCPSCPLIPPQKACTKDQSKPNPVDSARILNKTIAALVATQNQQYVDYLKGTRREPGLLTMASIAAEDQDKRARANWEKEVHPPQKVNPFRDIPPPPKSPPEMINNLKRPNLDNIKAALNRCQNIGKGTNPPTELNDPTSAAAITTAVEEQKIKFGFPPNPINQTDPTHRQTGSE